MTRQPRGFSGSAESLEADSVLTYDTCFRSIKSCHYIFAPIDRIGMQRSRLEVFLHHANGTSFDETSVKCHLDNTSLKSQFDETVDNVTLQILEICE